MTQPNMSADQLRQNAATRERIDRELTACFAPEDAALRGANTRAQAAGMPAIQIDPLQGKLLQVLAVACGARKILEIGTLAGYSGAWLARALPPGGKLITLEYEPKHAAVAQQTFQEAGVADKVEIRVGPALDTLPALTGLAPFDLFFIDADKVSYPAYLDWAIKLSRPGSIIIADNVIRAGRPFENPPPDVDHVALAQYDAQIATDPRLVSVAFPIGEAKSSGLDGLSISVVRPSGS